MILRFYSPLSIKCESPRYVMPSELTDVLDALPVSSQKYFDDMAESFDEHYLLVEHTKNYAVHSVVPMPCIHHSTPYMCWLVTIEIKHDDAYKPFNISQCILDIRQTLDNQITGRWGNDFEDHKINIKGDTYSAHCSVVDRVTWPGIWCDDVSLLPCSSPFCRKSGIRSNLLKHGWLEPETFDRFCADIKRWVHGANAESECLRNIQHLAIKYHLDDVFIEATVNWIVDPKHQRKYERIKTKIRLLRLGQG